MEVTFDLRTAAEERAGSAFSDEKYQMVLPEARRKLERINDMNGTHHGEPYLAILIAEAVQAQWLTRYLNAANDMWEQARLEGLT
ncbi:hypothetical protein [uncultured Oscillibacter sp.]|uniref:hypothetical protein n=1 Tax=uncultured Oscillibacter sp. TaxID=876091 RepID=UPI00262C2D84|nr:hypothetical protein [uncultured Oscillibacter sp.]